MGGLAEPGKGGHKCFEPRHAGQRRTLRTEGFLTLARQSATSKPAQSRSG
jgi:hypothetical protein